MTLRLALTHANSLLAEALLEQLAESGFSADQLVLLDSTERAGNRLSFGDTYLETLDQGEFDYEDLAAVWLLQAEPGLEDLLQHADCPVISHHFDPQHAAQTLASVDRESFQKPGQLKLPDAELCCLHTVLEPLITRLPINAVQVVSIRSASFYGQAVIEELASQTINLLNGRQPEPGSLPLQMAFNPQTVMLDEKKALQLSDLLDGQVNCSLQVLLAPAFHGNAFAVTLIADRALDAQEIEHSWSNLNQFQLQQGPVSSLSHCTEGNSMVASSLWVSQQNPNLASFWLVTDSVKNPLLEAYIQSIKLLQIH